MHARRRHVWPVMPRPRYMASRQPRPLVLNEQASLSGFRRRTMHASKSFREVETRRGGNKAANKEEEEEKKKKKKKQEWLAEYRCSEPCPSASCGDAGRQRKREGEGMEGKSSPTTSISLSIQITHVFVPVATLPSSCLSTAVYLIQSEVRPSTESRCRHLLGGRAKCSALQCSAVGPFPQCDACRASRIGNRSTDSAARQQGERGQPDPDATLRCGCANCWREEREKRVVAVPQD